jgi:outer membrane protein
MKRTLLASRPPASARPGPRNSGGGHGRADLPSPLDLKGAVGYALDHNFTILQARETIRLQEGVIVQVRGPGDPQRLRAGPVPEERRDDLPDLSSCDQPLDVELKATQNLFAGGGIESAIKGAKLTRDAAALDLQTRSTPRSSTCAPSSTT